MTLKPVNFSSVKIDDCFWTPRRDVNRQVTIPHQYKMCKEIGHIDAFGLKWKNGDPNPPHIFWDSDVAKWIEAASYSLKTNPDPHLDKLLDEVIALIASAQQSDGYLNCHFTVVEPGKRWTNLRDCHELYCAGHLMEAAVAHYEATGKRTLLDVLCRYAGHIETTFGASPGKKRGYCGHPEIELGLVRLAKASGNERYLTLAKYFVDERGRQPSYFDQEALARGEDPRKYWAKDYSYCQSHKPLREQTEVVGHAVRAFYMYSGMADVAAATGDAGLLAACKKLWQDVTARKMYVHGGIGPSQQNEGFTGPYDLPNATAYAETCAAIALVFFAHRMLQFEADSQYADAMERALYNGIVSGVSLDGKKFFYVNRLAALELQSGPQDHLQHSRKEWFGCACCPPNVARLLASLGSYVYSTSDRAAYVHLYVGGEASIAVAGQDVTLTQETRYPWDGEVRITVKLSAPARFDLMLRIPGWCRKYKATLNGKSFTGRVVKGYLRIPRAWADGDVVQLSLAMPVERIVAHPLVDADTARVALQRGPILYCLEQCDSRADLRTLALPDKAKLTARFDPKLLGGCVVIEGLAQAAQMKSWAKNLYQTLDKTTTKPMRIKAVPYCLWDNRAPGQMIVWLPRV